MNYLNSTILLLLFSTFLACSTPGLERIYNEATIEEDLKAVSEEISNDEFLMLKDYILSVDPSTVFLSQMNYTQLLSKSREKKAKDDEKKYQEKVKQEALEKEQKLAKLNLEKAELLADKKWIITEYAFLVEIPNDSEENVDLATSILNKAMFIKDAEFIFSVEKENRKTFVKGKFDEKLTKFMNQNGKYAKEYFKNREFKITSGKEIQKGTWTFTDENKIREERPYEKSSSFRRNAKVFYNLEVKQLSGNTFAFTEKKLDYLSNNSIISTFIVMEMK